jgi:hypothetical protein
MDARKLFGFLVLLVIFAVMTIIVYKDDDMSINEENTGSSMNLQETQNTDVAQPEIHVSKVHDVIELINQGWSPSSRLENNPSEKKLEYRMVEDKIFVKHSSSLKSPILTKNSIPTAKDLSAYSLSEGNYDYLDNYPINIGKVLHGRIIHIELSTENEMWISSNHNCQTYGCVLNSETDTSSNVIGKANSSWIVKRVGPNVILESVGMPGYFLNGYDPYWPITDYLVFVDRTYSSYPYIAQYLWEILCQTPTFEKCVIRQHSGRYLSTLTSPWLFKDSIPSTILSSNIDGTSIFQILAPTPTQYAEELYNTVNEEVTAENKYFIYSFGVSIPDSSNTVIQKALSEEIEYSFEWYSNQDCLSTSIAYDWKSLGPETWNSRRNANFTFELPPRSRVVIKQLVGRYSKYKVERKDLIFECNWLLDNAKC